MILYFYSIYNKGSPGIFGHLCEGFICLALQNSCMSYCILATVRKESTLVHKHLIHANVFHLQASRHLNQQAIHGSQMAMGQVTWLWLQLQLALSCLSISIKTQHFLHVQLRLDYSTIVQSIHLIYKYILLKCMSAIWTNTYIYIHRTPNCTCTHTHRSTCAHAQTHLNG